MGIKYKKTKLRKKMKKTKLLIICISSLLALSCSKNNKVEQTYFESMNTFMKVQAYGENAKEANEAAQKYIGQLERIISATKEESDIYKLNHSETYPVKVNEQALSLIKLALNMSEISDGAFNPCLYPVSSLWGFTKKQYRIPSEEEIAEKLALCDWKKVQVTDDGVIMEPGMQFDLGGIGKGFAGDEAAKKMKEFGIKSALLDLGGNIQIIGTKPDGSDWTIGIRNPFEEGAIGILKASNVAVITSAGYERYFVGEDGKKYIHIFDGTTGCPAESDLVSTTAIAPSGTYCDGLSTALYVLGLERSIELWRKQKNFDFILITKNKEVYITKRLASKFTIDSTLGFTSFIIK